MAPPGESHARYDPQTIQQTIEWTVCKLLLVIIGFRAIERNVREWRDELLDNVSGAG